MFGAWRRSVGKDLPHRFPGGRCPSRPVNQAVEHRVRAGGLQNRASLDTGDVQARDARCSRLSCVTTLSGSGSNAGIEAAGLSPPQFSPGGLP